MKQWTRIWSCDRCNRKITAIIIINQKLSSFWSFLKYIHTREREQITTRARARRCTDGVSLHTKRNVGIDKRLEISIFSPIPCVCHNPLLGHCSFPDSDASRAGSSKTLNVKVYTKKKKQEQQQAPPNLVANSPHALPYPHSRNTVIVISSDSIIMRFLPDCRQFLPEPRLSSPPPAPPFLSSLPPGSLALPLSLLTRFQLKTPPKKSDKLPHL
jgi:hypothetical protein